MKLKTNRRNYERVCTQCDNVIPRGQKYGQKTKSIAMKQTHWGIDRRPKEEIPDWAWETVRMRKEFDYCEKCSVGNGWVSNAKENA